MTTYTIAFIGDHLFLCEPDGPETESKLTAHREWARRYARDSNADLKIERGLTLTNEPVGLWDYVAFNSDDYARIERDDNCGAASYLYEDSEIARGLFVDGNGHYFSYAMRSFDWDENGDCDIAENHRRATIGRDEKERAMNDERQAAIVNWFAKSKLAHQLRTLEEGKEGFFVLKGTRARLQDGSIVEVLDWLRREGIIGGKSIDGYSVLYTPPEGQFKEKLTFFRAVYDAPFSPCPEPSTDDFDDDIPF